MQYFELLHEIKKKKLKRGQDLQPPLPLPRLEKLRAEVEEQFNQTLPWAYCELLSMTNGLTWESLFIYGDVRSTAVGYTERFIPGFLHTNLGLRDIDGMEDFLIFGDDDTLLYTYCVSETEFQTLLKSRMALVDTYQSFAAMLTFALELNRGE
ncbi:MAG: YrhA family protein [Gemmataceae bacterium]